MKKDVSKCPINVYTNSDYIITISRGENITEEVIPLKRYIRRPSWAINIYNREKITLFQEDVDYICDFVKKKLEKGCIKKQSIIKED